MKTNTLSLLLPSLVALVLAGCGPGQPSTKSSVPSSNAPPSEASIELAPGQLSAIKIAGIGTYAFPLEKEAVGQISFVDDLSVQIFPPYQGKIIRTFVELGDDVTKGQPVYSIESPDLILAESTLISAAATLEVTSKELARVKDLAATNGVSQRELEQATSDQQSAEGALKAAQDALHVFGKSDAEIGQIIASRSIDPALVVRSPITGRITDMNAPPGLLVQPGVAPAPFSVADTSLKWMLANATETDSPSFREGQPVRVKVIAYPDRVFEGKVSKVYAAVDANTHHLVVRSEVADPKNELRPGLLASFVIQVQPPVESVSIPMTGVVRNGDGTMAAWVTVDRRRFTQRILKIGLQRDGQYQVLEGLRKDELAVTDGAIFLSNMLSAPPTD